MSGCVRLEYCVICKYLNEVPIEGKGKRVKMEPIVCPECKKKQHMSDDEAKAHIKQIKGRKHHAF